MPHWRNWRWNSRDRGVGRVARVLAGLDRVVLGGQAERVVAHRVQHPAAGAAVEVRDRVADRVDLQVADVRLAARVREHLEHVAGVGRRPRRWRPATSARPPRPAASAARSPSGRSGARPSRAEDRVAPDGARLRPGGAGGRLPGPARPRLAGDAADLGAQRRAAGRRRLRRDRPGPARLRRQPARRALRPRRPRARPQGAARPARRSSAAPASAATSAAGSIIDLGLRFRGTRRAGRCSSTAILPLLPEMPETRAPRPGRPATTSCARAATPTRWRPSSTRRTSAAATSRSSTARGFWAVARHVHAATTSTSMTEPFADAEQAARRASATTRAALGSRPLSREAALVRADAGRDARPVRPGRPRDLGGLPRPRGARVPGPRRPVRRARRRPLPAVGAGRRAERRGEGVSAAICARRDTYAPGPCRTPSHRVGEILAAAEQTADAADGQPRRACASASPRATARPRQPHPGRRGRGARDPRRGAGAGRARCCRGTAAARARRPAARPARSSPTRTPRRATCCATARSCRGNLRDLSDSLRSNAELLLRDIRLAHAEMTARLDQAAPPRAGTRAARAASTTSTCPSSTRAAEPGLPLGRGGKRRAAARRGAA